MIRHTRVHRIRRSVRALALALLPIAGCAAEDGYRPSDACPVPAEPVGRWNGGSNELGRWHYEFSDNGAPITSTWSARGGLLSLDGYSYVPVR